MIKITDKNRNLVLLGATLLSGILVIGALMFFESMDIQGVEIVKDKANSNYKTLESKIQSLKNQNFDPNCYNTLSMEIETSYSQDLITGSAKTQLMSDLANAYADLVYNKCQTFLVNNIGSSQDIINLLNQLEIITSKNSRIDRYRNQIKWHQYYSITLSEKVNDFIRPGIINYDEGRYQLLRNEVQNMPNLDPAYKNNNKFNSIKKSLIKELQQFNSDFYSSELEIE